jgi:hypothetical protein
MQPVVNFKDLNLSVDDELESEEMPCLPGGGEGSALSQYYSMDEDPTNKALIYNGRMARTVGVQRNRLVIILVGLPGRGKTFLCNKLKCYLNW